MLDLSPTRFGALPFNVVEHAHVQTEYRGQSERRVGPSFVSALRPMLILAQGCLWSAAFCRMFKQET